MWRRKEGCVLEMLKERDGRSWNAHLVSSMINRSKGATVMGCLDDDVEQRAMMVVKEVENSAFGIT